MKRKDTTMKHFFTSDGGVLEVERGQLLDLRALADDESEPGAAVSVSDLLAAALDDYLAPKRKRLASIANRP
jgi:hypothetical protein